MVYTSMQQIIDAAKTLTSKTRMAVAAAADEHTIEAAVKAMEAGIVIPVLVGDKAKIKEILAEMKVTAIPDEDIYDEADVAEAAKKAVALVREGNCQAILKGKLDTGVLLKQVVNKETGIGMGKTMSHFTIFEVPTHKKLFAGVDGGMVTYPTLEQKKDIIDNTVMAMRAMGYDCPKVGVLACVEKVNPKMPETLDGAALKEMNQKGEIKHCIVEGPISYDCAISKEIADFKGFESPCAGDCDILIVPNIHAGNILGKMVCISAQGKMAGIIVGAKCPISMTSRGSTPEEKFTSIVLAALVAQGMKNLED